MDVHQIITFSVSDANCLCVLCAFVAHVDIIDSVFDKNITLKNDLHIAYIYINLHLVRVGIINSISNFISI